MVGMRDLPVRQVDWGAYHESRLIGTVRKLSADGVQSEVRSDSCPDIGKVLAFNDQIPLAGCAERLRNAPVHAA
jgi:hypothetical protein